MFVCGGFASDAKSVGFVGSGVPEYMAKSNATLFFFFFHHVCTANGLPGRYATGCVIALELFNPP